VTTKSKPISAGSPSVPGSDEGAALLHQPAPWRPAQSLEAGHTGKAIAPAVPLRTRRIADGRRNPQAPQRRLPCEGGGRCGCKAGYEASVSSKREGMKIRKTFRRKAEARTWAIRRALGPRQGNSPGIPTDDPRAGVGAVDRGGPLWGDHKPERRHLQAVRPALLRPGDEAARPPHSRRRPAR